MAVKDDALEVSQLSFRDKSPRKVHRENLMADDDVGDHVGDHQVVVRTKKIISKHAGKLVKRADEHEKFLNKIKYCLGVFLFGTFCYLLGSRPQDIPYFYCVFFITVAPLRWIYYRMRKWHYFLFDFCYYANAIFMVILLAFPSSERSFMVCFAFAEGPLAWALIIWRCSLVFNSFDKIISVLIHLLPGLVFYIIRWWDPSTFTLHSRDVTGPWPAWPLVQSNTALWTWLFAVPLLLYSIWQAVYFLIVNKLREKRLANDPEVMTSFRELSRKASKANNIWWRISGILGDNNRVVMYIVLQALLTVVTMALAVPLFQSYRLHTIFQLLKVVAAIWNGGNFFFEVMPRQADAKKRKRIEVLGTESAANKKQETEGAVENGFVNSAESNGTESPVMCAVCRKLSVTNMEDILDSSMEVVEQKLDGDDTEEEKDSTTRLRKRATVTHED